MAPMGRAAKSSASALRRYLRVCYAGAVQLPPTTPALLEASSHPYFLWWTDCTVAQLRQRLAEGDPQSQAYWLGALLREANTRDVWLFTTPDRVRAMWPFLRRHLGRTRARWAWLLDIADDAWPPAVADR